MHRVLVQLADDSKKLDEDSEKLRRLADNAGALAQEKKDLPRNLPCMTVWLRVSH